MQNFSCVAIQQKFSTLRRCNTLSPFVHRRAEFFNRKSFSFSRCPPPRVFSPWDGHVLGHLISEFHKSIGQFENFRCRYPTFLLDSTGLPSLSRTYDSSVFHTCPTCDVYESESPPPSVRSFLTKDTQGFLPFHFSNVAFGELSRLSRLKLSK